MTVRRLMVEEDPEDGVGRLGASAARHAVKVLRLAPGDGVVLFNGRGKEWEGRVSEARRDRVLVEVGEAREAPTPSGPAVVLATALPKGRRLARLVTMATEAGVERIVPVLCRRSAVRELSPAARERLVRHGAEASRQSGRSRVPVVEAPVSLEHLLGRTIPVGELRLLPTLSEDAVPLVQLAAPLTSSRTVLLLVGPEGGFTEDEETAARFAGFRPCSLGDGILRVETAAVVAVALVRALAGGQ